MCINYNKLSSQERDQIQQIAKRIFTIRNDRGNKTPLMQIEMQLSAVHTNGCKLDLQRLLAASDHHLMRDYYGISQNLNMDTGQIENDYLPIFRLIPLPAIA